MANVRMIKRTDTGSLFYTYNNLNFKFSDFNKEITNSMKMIGIMIETCWSAFKCFNINILD